MLINLRNALMAGKRLPYDAEVEYLRVDAVGPYIVIDGVTYCNAVGTYYAFTISSGGVVTHDLIPVRLGNTGYMYDRITNKRFGNAGTGDFVLGPDVVPVEYIESHGTEYIGIPTTGIAGQYFGVSGTLQTTSTTDQYGKVLFESDSFRQFQATGYTASGAGFTYASYVGRMNAGGGFTVPITELGPFTLSTAGVTNLGDFNANSRPLTKNISRLYIFGSAGSGVSCAIGQLDVTSGNAVLNALRSIRVGTDATSWEGAMMDVLTRRIYRNAGTGAFSYGNDLKYPIPAS